MAFFRHFILSNSSSMLTESGTSFWGFGACVDVSVLALKADDV